MPVMGQSSFKNTAAVRADAAFTDEDSARRVLTIKGRTGAVVALPPVPTESAPVIRQAIVENLSSVARQQVKYIFTDSPSQKLWSELSKVLPILEALCLDPVHLAITYEYSTWRAMYAYGSLALLQLLVSFF